MRWDYLYTIAQTNAFEIPVYWLFLRRYLNFWECIFVVCMGNALTHPLVFFGFLGSHHSYFSSTLIAETFAPVVEAIVLIFAARISWRRAAVASLTANFVSWQFAPILTYLLFFKMPANFL